MDVELEPKRVNESKKKRDKNKSLHRLNKEYPHKTKNGRGIVGRLIKETKK